MKMLIVIMLLAVASWGVVAHHFPRIASSVPLLEEISLTLDDTGLSAAPGKLVDAGRDLSDAVKTRHFGGWHLAVIVIAVLFARKLLIMLLR